MMSTQARVVLLEFADGMDATVTSICTTDAKEFVLHESMFQTAEVNPVPREHIAVAELIGKFLDVPVTIV